jgi:hypothetical protein
MSTKTNQPGGTMNHYSHFTLKERELLKHYMDIGLNQSEIAIKLGRNKSSICRELKRNSLQGSYLPCDAQALYATRRKECRPQKKLDDTVLFQKVKSLFLEHQWSPEQIAARLKYEESVYSISFTTIYRAIYSGLFDEPNLSRGNRGCIRKLRHRGKSRHTKSYEERRGKIPITNPISERPDAAEKRQRLGDWEADTVAGKTGRACLLTLTDRKSRYLLCRKIPKKNAQCVKQAMIELLKDKPLQSITPDRGKEFSKHPEVSQQLSLVAFYFPLPHHPWQRGTNENTNGLLREYFPKTKDIDQSDSYVEAKIEEINRRPRKCLNWKTPYEVYYSVELHLI